MLKKVVLGILSVGFLFLAVDAKNFSDLDLQQAYDSDKELLNLYGKDLDSTEGFDSIVRLFPNLKTLTA